MVAYIEWDDLQAVTRKKLTLVDICIASGEIKIKQDNNKRLLEELIDAFERKYEFSKVADYNVSVPDVNRLRMFYSTYFNNLRIFEQCRSILCLYMDSRSTKDDVRDRIDNMRAQHIIPLVGELASRSRRAQCIAQYLANLARNNRAIAEKRHLKAQMKC